MRSSIFVSLFGRPGQRLVTLAVIGGILGASGITWQDAMFWCFLVMVLLVEFLGHQQGMADGIMMMHYATPEQRAQIRRIIEELEKQDGPTDSTK